MNVSYYDEKGRRHEAHDKYESAIVIRAGVRTRYLKRLRVAGYFEHDPHFVLPAGGMLAIDTSHPGYWESEQFKDKPHPDWAPAKLATLEFPRVGPYVIGGYGDPNGNGPSGQGVTPYRGDYRHCASGRRSYHLELLGMMNRTPIAYASPIDTDKYSLATPTPPLGYAVDYDQARRWDPDCMEYLRFKRHDGQHAARGYDAALWLWKNYDIPIAKEFARLYYEHVQMAWGPQERTPNTNRAYWGVDQWLASGKSREGCNREWAHVVRLVLSWNKTGVFAEALLKMLAQANQDGEPFFLAPTGANWARIKGGGPFGNDEPIAMTREWMLAGEALRLARSKHVEEILRNMVNFHGTRPAGAMNGEGEGYGNPNADYELFYNDLSQYEGKPARVLQVASSRHPESAAMPMDSWPRRFWEEFV